MSVNLADMRDGVPGRFVPDEMRGQLVEAEHLTRYWWASRFVAGRRVLDAGSGTGYGARLLAAAGAASVTGIDLAEDVVTVARDGAPETVTFDAGDVRALPYEDDSFDVVTCFEVIEHVAEHAAVLGEIARVLAPGGLLLVSSPNRDVYVPGNPHHVRELTPTELEAELAARWPHVALLQQHNFLASTILPPAAGEDGARLDGDVDVRRLSAKAPGEEVYTLGLASTAPLPEPPQLVTLASPVEVRQWLERFEEQQGSLRSLLSQLDAASRGAEDRRAALRELAASEQRIAELPELRAQVDALQEHVVQLAAERQTLEERLERADATLRSVTESPSWRVTAPLRAAKRYARRG